MWSIVSRTRTQRENHSKESEAQGRGCWLEALHLSKRLTAANRSTWNMLLLAATHGYSTVKWKVKSQSRNQTCETAVTSSRTRSLPKIQSCFTASTQSCVLSDTDCSNRASSSIDKKILNFFTKDRQRLKLFMCRQCAWHTSNPIWKCIEAGFITQIYTPISILLIKWLNECLSSWAAEVDTGEGIPHPCTFLSL